MKKIAVVILNWNGATLLQQFLPSILRYSEVATVYVADNASTDTSIKVLKTAFPQIKIIQNTGNFGFAKGYNEALRFVEEDIYALVNSDIEVTEDWLTPILQLFEKEPKTAIIQPKIKDYNNKDYFEYAGAGGGFIDKYGFPFCRGRIFETIEKDTGQYNDEQSIFWASGACFFIRKDVFRVLNGFDADFFAHQEEIDLCWRAFNDNYDVKYCGFSEVYHVGGATLHESNPKKTFLNFRNSLFMLQKNVAFPNVIIIILIRLFMDGLAGIHFILQGEFKHFIAVLKAHFYFYSNIISTSKKRKRNFRSNYYKTESIVYLCFLKKKRFYRNI